MARQFGNPEKFYQETPPSLDYVLRYGGIWYDKKALEVLKKNL